MRLKTIVFLFVTLFTNALCKGQDADNTSKPWHIALPLRFTYLQNSYTMLSGVHIGKAWTHRMSFGASVYHSFYINSIKPKANLAGFSKQPQLFINGVGLQLDYKIFQSPKWSFWGSLFTGWGFMKYDLKENNFKSSRLDFIALEPMCLWEYKLDTNTSLGFGVGYRPVFYKRNIEYQSAVGNGAISIDKQMPHGINVLVSLKGYLRK